MATDTSSSRATTRARRSTMGALPLLAAQALDVRVGLLQQILPHYLGELLVHGAEGHLEGGPLRRGELDDLAATPPDPLDVAGLAPGRLRALEGRQLPRRVPQHLLDVRRQPLVHLLAEEEGVPQEAVVGQDGVVLHLVELQ